MLRQALDLFNPPPEAISQRPAQRKRVCLVFSVVREEEKYRVTVEGLPKHCGPQASDWNKYVGGLFSLVKVWWTAGPVGHGTETASTWQVDADKRIYFLMLFTKQSSWIVSINCLSLLLGLCYWCLCCQRNWRCSFSAPLFSLVAILALLAC